METFDRLLITMLSLLFMIVSSLIYIDSRNTKFNTHLISVKLTHVQRLLDDIGNASYDLNIVGPIRDLNISHESNSENGEDLPKSIILEAISLKDDLIQECLFEAQHCIKDVLSELK